MTPDSPKAAAFRQQVLNPFKLRLFMMQNLPMAWLASGIQAMMHVQAGGAASMLVVGMEAEFTKKAVGLIAFSCPDGPRIAQALAESRATGEGRTVVATSTGIDEAGDVVAVFRITWSFKAKASK